MRRNIFRIGSSCIALLCGFQFFGCDQQPSAQKQTLTVNTDQIEYDMTVDFGQGGQAGPFRVSGWSKPEEKFTWSDGNTAVLAIPIPPTQERLTFRMTAAGLFKEPELPFQLVEVDVNGEKIADWQLRDTALFSATIPERLTKPGGILTFTFKIPRATSPKQLGVSEDARVLGMCVHNFELSKS